MKKSLISEVFPSLWLIVLMFVGCTSGKNNDGGIIEINDSNVQTVESIDLTEMFDTDCSYMALETHEGCLIGDIEDMQFHDDKLFILSSVSGDNEVLVFDAKGHFINKIGVRGRGPEEYVAISAFGVNPYGKYVVLVDPLKEKIHKYDYSGKYLESLKPKGNCAFLQRIRFISEDRMRCVYQINNSSDVSIAECNEDFGNYMVLSKTDFIFHGGYIFSESPITQNGSHLITPLSNIIYQYNSNRLDSVYCVTLNNNYQPNQKYDKGSDYSKLVVDAIKKSYSPLSIHENNALLMLQQFPYMILWDKKTNKGYKIKNATNTARYDYLPINSTSKVCDFNDGFIVVYSATDLHEMNEYYKRENIKPSKELNDLFKNVGFEDNPAILFWKIKRKE
ncbi:6-bladed beta-propeller [Puteibacter caeruleilacunae]|nr:6-bladed beta-propeller [Puteibacter caeruleilacunae]